MAKKIQFAALLYGDLKEDTITFEMEEPVTLQGGEYAIIKIENINERLALEKLYDYNLKD